MVTTRSMAKAQAQQPDECVILPLLEKGDWMLGKCKNTNQFYVIDFATSCGLGTWYQRFSCFEKALDYFDMATNYTKELDKSIFAKELGEELESLIRDHC